MLDLPKDLKDTFANFTFHFKNFTLRTHFELYEVTVLEAML